MDFRTRHLVLTHGGLLQFFACGISCCRPIPEHDTSAPRGDALLRSRRNRLFSVYSRMQLCDLHVIVQYSRTRDVRTMHLPKWPAIPVMIAHISITAWLICLFGCYHDHPSISASCLSDHQKWFLKLHTRLGRTRHLVYSSSSDETCSDNRNSLSALYYEAVIEYTRLLHRAIEMSKCLSRATLVNSEQWTRITAAALHDR